MTAGTDPRKPSPAWIVGPAFFFVLVLHAPLLRLPYFWDEAGYYIPAARDLLLSGSLIPHSTLSNAHPPLVMACLALGWKIFGYTPVVTRVVMLFLAAFALAGVFELARSVSNTQIAAASTLCTALYPVFFAQSSLAHVDLAAAGFTFWALAANSKGWIPAATVWFSLAALAKETAILVPVALFLWKLLSRFVEVREPSPGLHLIRPKERDANSATADVSALSSLMLLFPLLPLGLWYAYHYHRTGFLFGNPEFFRYNVQATLHPVRVVLALGLRLWQVLGYLSLYLLTVAAALAMGFPPIEDDGKPRPRISLDVQFSFLVICGVYVLAMAVIGGAVLARYMLPIVPLVIIVCVSTLHRRISYWRWVIAIVVAGFVIGLFVNPPYGFSIEDNLAYRDYILLHERAEYFLQERHPGARVLTAWPASDELTRPYLGYVAHPTQVLRIEDFTAEQLLAASELRGNFDLALVFSTKYEPPHRWLGGWHRWQRWKMEYFGYHRDVPPAAAAQILGGHLVYEDHRRGEWIAVIEVDRIEEARLRH